MVTDQHIRDLAEKQGWSDTTLADILLQWVCEDAGRYAKLYIHLSSIATQEQRLSLQDDPFADENEDPAPPVEYEPTNEEMALLMGEADEAA